MKVGAILKACRVRSGLSQEELADRLFINQSDISKFENDAKEPTISIFQQWMVNTQAQEVMVAFFCGFDGISIMQNIAQLMTGTIIGGMFNVLGF